MTHAERQTVRTSIVLHSRKDLSVVHHVGTPGTIVDVLGQDEQSPVYLVELRILDATLAGGAWYEVFELRAHEFCDT